MEEEGLNINQPAEPAKKTVSPIWYMVIAIVLIALMAWVVFFFAANRQEAPTAEVVPVQPDVVPATVSGKVESLSNELSRELETILQDMGGEDDVVQADL